MKYTYYGLFIRVNRTLIRVDTTTGYTYDTAKVRFAPLLLTLRDRGFNPELRSLRPVKQVDAWSADRKYAKTLW